jgi:transposase
MFVGLDVHKRYCYAAVLNSEGELVQEGKFLNTLEELDQFLLGLEPGSELVMEASSIWEELYDHTTERGFAVTVAHPLKVRAIASARIKTDRLDAQTLAHLLRAGLIPACYVPQPAIRELRSWVRHRACLVRWRTQVKNKIHRLLAQQGILPTFSDLFGKAGLQFLRRLCLPPSLQPLLQDYLAIVEVLNERIRLTTQQLEQQALTNSQAQLLTSVPGVGIYSALLLLAEIGEIDRFPSGKQLCSYAGLVPRVHQSGNVEYYGRITKQGSRWLRWILVQAAHTTVRTPNVIQRFYRKLARQKGSKVAIVAAARKLLTYIYQMLKQGVRFEELAVVQAQGRPVNSTGH